MTRDGRREVVGFFGLFGSLGLDFGFYIGVAGFLFGGRRGVVDGGVFAFGTGRDSEELVKGQDARFAATIALLAFMEDGDASCLRVSVGFD